MPQSTIMQEPKKQPQIIQIIIILVLIGVISYLYTINLELNRQIASLPPPNPPQTISPTPSPFLKTSLKINPITNHTVYVNSMYGFSFEYPQNVFVYHNELPYAFYLSNKENGGSPIELGANGLWLNMSFESGGQVMDTFYKQIMSLPSGGKIEQNAVTKISDLNTDGVVGVLFYQGIPKMFVGEPAHSYEAVWLHNGRTYRLFLAAQQYTILKQNESMFNQILSTFKFIN